MSSSATSEELAAVDRILKQPYSFIVIPDPEGSFSAQVLEFPGCFAQGLTAAEAHQNLWEAARSWVLAVLDARRSVPPPLAPQNESGRVTVQVPRSLHERAARIAAREGVSLDRFTLSLLAEAVGARSEPDHALPEGTSDATHFDKVLRLLHNAPIAYQELLRPVVLRALTNVQLRPFVRMLATDPFFEHLLKGNPAEPFLPDETARSNT